MPARPSPANVPPCGARIAASALALAGLLALACGGSSGDASAGGERGPAIVSVSASGLGAAGQRIEYWDPARHELRALGTAPEIHAFAAFDGGAAVWQTPTGVHRFDPETDRVEDLRERLPGLLAGAEMSPIATAPTGDVAWVDQLASGERVLLDYHAAADRLVEVAESDAGFALRDLPPILGPEIPFFLGLDGYLLFRDRADDRMSGFEPAKATVSFIATAAAPVPFPNLMVGVPLRGGGAFWYDRDLDQSLRMLGHQGPIEKAHDGSTSPLLTSGTILGSELGSLTIHTPGAERAGSFDTTRWGGVAIFGESWRGDLLLGAGDQDAVFAGEGSFWLFVYEASTIQVRTLAEDVVGAAYGERFRPAIARNGDVVWRDAAGQVWHHDLSRNESTRIAAGDDFRIGAEGHVLVLVGDPETPELSLYDPATGGVHALGAADRFAVGSGGDVAFSRDGVVGYFDLSAEELVTPPLAASNALAIAGCSTTRQVESFVSGLFYEFEPPCSSERGEGSATPSPAP